MINNVNHNAQILKKEYPDLISTTIHRYPENYEVIDFEKFLSRNYPTCNLFISESEWRIIRVKFNDKYGQMNWKQEENLFKLRGTLKKIPFTELKFYQSEIGINGPQHTRIDEPVLIIFKNNQLILSGQHAF